MLYASTLPGIILRMPQGLRKNIIRPVTTLLIVLCPPDIYMSYFRYLNTDMREKQYSASAFIYLKTKHLKDKGDQLRVLNWLNPIRCVLKPQGLSES